MLLGPVTTPGASAPPFLNQEGSFNGSPPQMRRGVRQPTDGVVVNRKVETPRPSAARPYSLGAAPPRYGLEHKLNG